MNYYVYILYSAKLDRYYTGSCEDIPVRFNQHNSGRNKSTKAGMPWVIRYTEIFDTKSQAVQREYDIKKKKSRIYIQALISSVK